VVKVFKDPEDAMKDIEDADCAYGYLPPGLFTRAKKLRWVQCHAAGPEPSFYHDALVNSDVVVTNFRGIYNDHVGHHAVGMLLALARRFHVYIPHQVRKEWKPAEPAVHLPESTVLVIGAGGIGSEVARVCKALGMAVLATDARIKVPPPYVDELHPAENLEKLLPRADFVVVTTPDTPQTRGMINARRLGLMKRTAFLINVGRGVCVVLNDLVDALRSGKIAGAALDVFEVEPLPPNHPLWTASNVLITPHIAAHEAPYLRERRDQVFLTNVQRFAKGESLINVVDKKNRF
jgi:phosphoglycerate dehydrogenase-like enzyme